MTEQHRVSLADCLGREVELDTIHGALYEAGQFVNPSAVRSVRHLVKAGIVELAELKSLDDMVCPMYILYQNYPHAAKNPAVPYLDWRINLTVLLPGTVASGRYVLTVGHQNAENQIEIHQVLSGKALFYQQFNDETGKVVGRYTLAEPGDLVSILPGAWHLTVNIGHEPMVMVDVVRFRGAKPVMNYHWRHRGGAAWFFVKPGKREGLRLVRNPAYDEKLVGPIQEIAPSQFPTHLKCERWLPLDYVHNAALLDYWTGDEYWQLLRACRWLHSEKHWIYHPLLDGHAPSSEDPLVLVDKARHLRETGATIVTDMIRQEGMGLVHFLEWVERKP